MSEPKRSCIDACVECAQECERCAMICLNAPEASRFAECIRSNGDCAEICWLAAAFLSRGSQFMEEVCRLCMEICEACAGECEQFPSQHCGRCAESCRACAETLRQLVAITV